jgi:hypothetical protein
MQCELLAWSNGYDEAEARKYASETLLKSTDAGASIVIGVVYPEPATQRASLVIRMPRTLAVRVQPSRGKLDISDVASVEMVEARAAVSIARVKGRVSGTHRGGPLTIESVGTLKLNTRGSVITLKDVKGEIALQVQAGEVRGEALAGPIEIESNGTRIAFDDLSRTRTPIRINAVTGAVALAGIWTDTRIDGRDTRITVKIDRPAPIAIYTEGDDPLEVTLPRGGYQLDALATNAELTVPSGLPDVKSTGEERRATGPVDGGGPTITLRNTHGTIVLRARDTTS